MNNILSEAEALKEINEVIGLDKITLTQIKEVVSRVSVADPNAPENAETVLYSGSFTDPSGNEKHMFEI